MSPPRTFSCRPQVRLPGNTIHIGHFTYKKFASWHNPYFVIPAVLHVALGGAYVLLPLAYATYHVVRACYVAARAVGRCVVAACRNLHRRRQDAWRRFAAWFDDWSFSECCQNIHRQLLACCRRSHRYRRRSQPKPEPTPEQAPEPFAEPSPEPEPESKLESEQHPRPEPESQPDPIPDPEPEPDTGPANVHDIAVSADFPDDDEGGYDMPWHI